nr:PREDICTED: protein O-mannosyltransferase 1 [Bemisia tabaci]
MKEMVKGKKGMKNGSKPTKASKTLSEDEGDHPKKIQSSVDDQNTAAEVPNNVHKTKPNGVAYAKMSPKTDKRKGIINMEVDIVSLLLFVIAACTRFYRLSQPNAIVFDELHYGKYVGLYMKRTFFFDSQPPFGKQLISAAAYLAGFDGKYKFEHIASEYSENVPVVALRFIPALCGSLLVPTAYHFMLEMGSSQWTALIAAILFLCDNALLTQSRFVLMESILLFFSLFGLLCLQKFRKLKSESYSLEWWAWLFLASVFLTFSFCVKLAGWFSWCLAMIIISVDYWDKVLGNKLISDVKAFLGAVARILMVCLVPVLIYLSIFYVHLTVLNKAGPHDSIMTSAFQASLEGGLASITKGQPLKIAHGSQITLRHTHGKLCWLHSHQLVYPLRYPDKRGSSHQQQVTCYTFKDVNNWWIVKRPNKSNLVVSQPIDVIKHGDVIQLIHGITSRALNSHDVAAPMSPQNQEVSCYIDYNVSMPAQNLWRVELSDPGSTDNEWHTIQSQVRLVHVNSSQALKFSGKQLPDWAFFQYEVVADKEVQQRDTIWNVEEHRYTKTDDEKLREKNLLSAEMIPLTATTMSFWQKFVELQYKMFFSHLENVKDHIFSSEPIEWPLMSRGIAYWLSSTSEENQIYLIGNRIIWRSGVISLLMYAGLFTIYLLRRRRLCYDLPQEVWDHFVDIGKFCVLGYSLHYLPFFFAERTLFLHHYFPALVFKILLTAAMVEHIDCLLKLYTKINLVRIVSFIYYILVCLWLVFIFYSFRKFLPFSYGSHLSNLSVMKVCAFPACDFQIDALPFSGW